MSPSTIESFISATAYRITPISESEWKEEFKLASYFKVLEEHIPTGKIKVVTGKCFCVSWMKPHECDCELCEKMEPDDRFFTDKSEAEEFMKQVESDSDNDDIDIDDYYFIKVVKQLPPDGGLFND